MTPLAESFMSHNIAPTNKYLLSYLDIRRISYRYILRRPRFFTSYDPIRIPIVQFSESTAGYKESVRQVNRRMPVGIYFDVFVHFTG